MQMKERVSSFIANNKENDNNGNVSKNDNNNSHYVSELHMMIESALSIANNINKQDDKNKNSNDNNSHLPWVHVDGEDGPGARRAHDDSQLLCSQLRR